jgi:hypothetical protein
MMRFVNEFDKFKEFRAIHTGIYGQCAYDILRSIEGQLSDGRWENSPRMEGYWKNEYILFDSEENPEIVIIVNKNASEYNKIPDWYDYKNNIMHYRYKWVANPFAKMTEEKILCWFADKIRQMVNYEMKDNDGKNWWTKQEERELDYLGYKIPVTIKECKTVYRMLKSFNN